MAWQDNIKEAAYNSATGVRIVFDYENVALSFDKKTTAFEFPDANGTYVQDLGRTGRRYPIRAFFWGDNHDLTASAFLDALGETGEGRLEHPLYGTINVVPFGSIKRRDDLKTEANQSIIEVTFFETTGLIYPTVQGDPASSILNSIEDFNAASAEQFDDVMSLEGTVEKQDFLNTYDQLLGNVKETLTVIADTQADVQKQFNAIYDSINDGIDVLISTPANIAFSTLQLIQSPARALTNIEARLSAYKDLYESILTDGDVSVTSNTYHANELYANGYVSAAALSAINNQFQSKPEALSAAEAVLEAMEGLTVWHDENYQTLNEIDTGETYQQLLNIVSLTAGFLVEISFTLKQERKLVLPYARNVLDLTSELYGSRVDDLIDFFIQSNNLSGSEILELPAGREIVYYV